jgi:large subunit ribosomal protein L30
MTSQWMIAAPSDGVVQHHQSSGFKKVLAMADRIKVTLVKSGIGKNAKIRETLKGLGLTRMNKLVELQNTPAVRGMIDKVSFLVRVG